MALRPRNIALEGFAHDFYTPATIALAGLSADSGIVAVLTETQAAQTDAVQGTVTQPQIVAPPSGGGGYYAARPPRRRRPKAPRPAPRPVPLPIRDARLVETSPAQTDSVTCEVAPLPRVAVLVEFMAPQTDEFDVFLWRVDWRLEERRAFLADRTAWRLADRDAELADRTAWRLAGRLDGRG